MSLFTYVLIFGISLALIVALTGNVGEIFQQSKDIERYNQALFFMKSLDRNVREVLSEEGESQRVLKGNPDVLLVSDKDNTLKYSLDIKEDFIDLGNFEEGEVKITSEKTRIELMLNYTGFADILNNATIQGDVVVEKVNNTAVRITEK